MQSLSQYLTVVLDLITDDGNHLVLDDITNIVDNNDNTYIIIIDKLAHD